MILCHLYQSETPDIWLSSDLLGPASYSFPKVLYQSDLKTISMLTWAKWLAPIPQVLSQLSPLFTPFHTSLRLSSFFRRSRGTENIIESLFIHLFILSFKRQILSTHYGSDMAIGTWVTRVSNIEEQIYWKRKRKRKELVYILGIWQEARVCLCFFLFSHTSSNTNSRSMNACLGLRLALQIDLFA